MDDGFVFAQGASSLLMASTMMGSKYHHPPVYASGAATTMFLSKAKPEKKSHSEAESRRRKRINDHLTSIREILPSKIKTDKATLLMETVQYVKELQEKFAEVAGGGDDGEMKPPLPTESDLVAVRRTESEDYGNVTATICCEDRAGLNRDLAQTIRLVRGKMIKTEMATVGGRTKLVMKLKLSGGKKSGMGEEIERLKRRLAAVVENRVSGCLMGLGMGSTGRNKRGRFTGPNRTDGGLFIGGVSRLC